MAPLVLSSIPDDLSLRDDNLLRNLDERCVRSLGGGLLCIGYFCHTFYSSSCRFTGHGRNFASRSERSSFSRFSPMYKAMGSKYVVITLFM
jgi:hypothetical protein